MGLAASQGRLLMITARMSDVEFSSQQIQQQKMRLAMSTESITAEYTNALDKMKLVGNTFVNGASSTVDLNYNNLTGDNSPLAGKYIILDSDKKVLVSADIKAKFDSAKSQGGAIHFSLLMTGGASDAYYLSLYSQISANGCTTISKESQSSSEWLTNKLDNGAYLQKLVTTDGKSQFADTDVASSNEISEVRDTADLKIIEAKYDEEMAKIQNKDKRYDMSIKQLDTEHTALQTEAESVKKVIDKNIESSFKTFG